MWQVRDAGRDPTAGRGVGHAWLHPEWSAPSREDRLKAAIDTLAAVGICASHGEVCPIFFAFIFFMRLRTQWTFTVLSTHVQFGRR